MKTADAVAAYVKARRALVETALEPSLPPSPQCPQMLRDAMRYSLTAGGKRVRPVLCLAGAEAVGAPAEAALRTACALERSEEHTSELQSQSNLVCRLLLEKKKRPRVADQGNGGNCVQTVQ